MFRAMGAYATARAALNFFLRRRTFSAPLPGDRRRVALRFGTTDYDVYTKVIVQSEYEFPSSCSPFGIIDAGANIGLAAIFFALRYPAATIVAIEPEAGNFRLLCENVAPFPNIHPVRGALWSHVSELSLVNPGLGSWGFRVEEASGAPLRIRALTVDEVMREHSLSCVDILKLDIEGAEREVLSSSPAWIDRVGSIVAELHEAFSPGATEAFQRATERFPIRWVRGENQFAARAEFLRSALPPGSSRA